MKLCEKSLTDKHAWEKSGFSLPQYDRDVVRKNTTENPFWIHFGAGNIFRAFQANVVQNLLNQGVLDRGLIVAEGFDYEIIEKINRPCDDLSILATLRFDGTVAKTVVGSVVESLLLDSDNDAQFGRLKTIFEKESLQMATFTITEKGYSLVDGKGKLLAAIEEDFKRGPLRPQSYLGKVASLLLARYRAKALPIALVSMDNCSHNGTKLHAAIDAFAKAWCENGLAESGFVEYVNDPQQVSFPWTMIDKITPRPNPSVEQILKEDGIEGLNPIITTKNTYVAPFVNAEECEYLVIEDAFPNGRPPLEKGGLLFTDRKTVELVERMKVCTCLNPLHTALAVFGCILGYDRIYKEMQDETLVALIKGIGYKEGLPVVADPGILDPKAFIDTVVNVRFPNPFMPDTPQRIATDTSQKLSIRYGETIKAYCASESLNSSDLKLIPLVFAGWLRYLMAVDDEGEEFDLSPDPLLNRLAYMKEVRLGSTEGIDELLDPLLSKESIFGIDLHSIGMAEQVKALFKEMIRKPHAVKETLEKYVTQQ